MRARRFRPCVDFRPSLDLLMPRIAPSDITTILISDPNPVADDPTPPGSPATPAIPVTTPAAPPVDSPTVGC
ncbi:MAG TPA: hypothetical protein VGH33_23395 [Isosphaeraceae bacterium]|jgi:hypothetical protein